MDSCSIRSSWCYLVDAEVVTSDPLPALSIPKRQHRLPECLRAEELRALLAAEACEAVADWLEFRRPDCGHDCLITTLRGNRITSSRMQRIWRGILVRSGITRPGVTMRTVRHSAATLLL